VEYSGHRAIHSEIRKYTGVPYEKRGGYEYSAGSTYNDRLDFVAPMFDIEVLNFKSKGKQGVEDIYPYWADGNSYSVPMVAAVSSLIFHAYFKKFGIEPTPSVIYEVLKQTAEMNSKAYDIILKE